MRRTEKCESWSKDRKEHLFRIGREIEHHDRPSTRADCERSPRPCPYVGCKFHTYLEVKNNGNITIRFPETAPEDMITPSCVLDVADEGGASLKYVGKCLNMTRERTRQLQEEGLEKIRESPTADRSWIDEK